jgi:cytochrome bd-type quinol oxidase subunit 2
MWFIAGASTLSAIWILTANAWMQHPVGYTLRNGRAELESFAAVIFQRFAILEFIHTISAAYILSAFFGIIGLFPKMFPSSLSPDYTLTAHNASSSPLTLKIMLIVVLIFVPIVLIYQIWTYNLFKGKVTKEDLAYEDAY